MNKIWEKEKQVRKEQSDASGHSPGVFYGSSEAIRTGQGKREGHFFFLNMKDFMS